MGTDVCSDDRGWASPRISFSRDLSPWTGEEQRSGGTPPPNDGAADASEFGFSISIEMSALDPSPADDIFSDGMILPLPIKSSAGTPSASSPPPPKKPNHAAPPVPILDRKGSLREIIAAPDGEASGGGDTNINRADCCRRSFWRFGRSSSTGHSRKPGLICPFPLALPRSKSTGSYLNPNQKPRRNSNHKNNISSSRNNNSSPSFDSFRKASGDSDWKASYYYPSGNRGSGGNGIRISPVLNVPAPLIPRGGGGSNSSCSSSTSSSFNTSVLAYLLCNCKDKSMKRSASCASP